VTIDLDNQKLSLLVGEQLPDFVRSDHALFQKFMEVYYEHEETPGNAYHALATILQNQDLDKTPTALLNRYIKSMLYADWDVALDTDLNKRTFLKNIIDIYQHKGDERSYEALFRAVYDDDVSFYYPSSDLFRSSDSTYQKYDILRIADVSGDVDELITSDASSLITGDVSLSLGTVEKVSSITNKVITLTLVQDGTNEFETGELVTQTTTLGAGGSCSATVFNWADGTEDVYLEFDSTDGDEADAGDNILLEDGDIIVREITRTLTVGFPGGSFDFIATDDGYFDIDSASGAMEGDNILSEDDTIIVREDPGDYGNVIGSDSEASWKIMTVEETERIAKEIELSNIVGTFLPTENITATGLVSDVYIDEAIKNIVTSSTITDMGSGYVIGESLRFLGSGGGIPGTITVGDIVNKASVTFTGDGSQVLWPLLDTGDTEHSVVIVNGVTQTQYTEYKIIGNNLTMVTAPTDGYLIEVRYTDGPISKLNIDDNGSDFPILTDIFSNTSSSVTLVLSSVINGNIILNSTDGSIGLDVGDDVLLEDATGTGDFLLHEGDNVGTYVTPEVTTQVIDPDRNASGTFVSWSSGTRTLVLKQMSQKFELINEGGSGNLIGQTSGASYTIDSLTPTIVLGSGASLIDDIYNDMGIWITGGTGVGQLVKITDYVGRTKIATLEEQFTINPNSTSTYSIVPLINSDGYYALDSTDGASGTDRGDEILLEDVLSTNGPAKLIRDDSAKVLLTTDATGMQLGTSIDDTGQLNELNYIQDSKLYQDYSYQLITSSDISKWESSVRSILHPAGTEVFGKVLGVSAVGGLSDSHASVFITGAGNVVSYVSKSELTALGASGIMLDALKDILKEPASVYDSVKGAGGAGGGINTYDSAESLDIELEIGGSGTFTVGEKVVQQDSSDATPNRSQATAIVTAWNTTTRILSVGTIEGTNTFLRTTGTVGNIIGSSSAASFKVANNIVYTTNITSDKISFGAPSDIDFVFSWNVTVTSGADFTQLETVTGSVSGANGIVRNWNNPDDIIHIDNITGEGDIVLNSTNGSANAGDNILTEDGDIFVVDVGTGAAFSLSDTITGTTSSTAASLDSVSRVSW